MATGALHASYGLTAGRKMEGPPLHTCEIQKPRAILSRAHMFFHAIAISALLYYRISNLLHGSVPFVSWTFITISEMIFTFIWVLTQAFRWRPVVRTVVPENLPRDDQLPGVDVFVCTADPTKEPVVEVMNTVLSAMALDYPSEKLAVYLSDDGGAAVTLYAIKEACEFARSWIPFCRKYEIKTRCPEAYFSWLGDAERLLWSREFKAEEQSIKSKYESFKRNVEKAAEVEASVRSDRPPYVELRVSGIMSNAPYVLVLDCDMYCNDPSSAKQAMCFHLDPKISSSLSYIQYPQIFYNVSKNDIYDGQARSAYKTKYQGMDGINGTVCSGTGYYLKKKALFGCPDHEDEFLDYEPGKNFGFSSKFITSLKALNGKKVVNEREILSDATLEEAKNMTSCSFEENTKWGKEIGYSYDSLLESTFTGYLLHCKGWKSVYLYPKRPCFLGCTTVDMNDALVQLMKWASGLVQVGFSRFSPLTYGVSRMSLLQSMCYGYFAFTHFFSVACLLYGITPQLCFLFGIPLFPKVTDLWFAAFATVFVSSQAQHLYEVLSSGGSIRTWWNEQRIWMIKSVTACLFGCLDVLMKWIGVAKTSFRLTNKAIDQEKLEKYEKGKFNLKGAKTFMVPLSLLVLLNLGCFIGGVKGLISGRNIEEMFGQGALSLYILVLSVPILEGLIRKMSK